MVKQPNESTPNPHPERHYVQLWLFPECAADAHVKETFIDGLQPANNVPTSAGAAMLDHKPVERQMVLFPECFDDADTW